MQISVIPIITFLSGVLENRADLYNFKSDSENKVRSSMILTGEYTDGGVSYPSGNLGALTTKNGTTMHRNGGEATIDCIVP